MSLTKTTGINRLLVPWSIFLGENSSWVQINHLTGEFYDLPSTSNEPDSRFSKRYDDIMAMMNNFEIGQIYDLNLGDGIQYSNVVANTPTSERKFSSLRGTDLRGNLPVGYDPGAGPFLNMWPDDFIPIAIEGDVY